MSSEVPKIKVTPADRENSVDKSNIFSWHPPKFEVSSSYPTKNENPQLRFFGMNNKGLNIYFKSEKVNSDISDSLQTLGLVNWENTFNMRSYNLNNFPTNTTSYKTAYRSQAVAMQRARLGFVNGTAKSLDLLRQNMQKFINKEIDDIIQKYIERFFKPGIENIKVNNGESSVSDQHLHSVCRQILEEAKKMYQNTSNRGTSPAEFVELENSSSSEQKPTNNFLKALIKKRKESDTDSEASFIPVKPKKRKGRPPNVTSGRSTPMKFRIEQVRREGPKWDPDRLHPNTQFIMGAKANKALGLGATRGRLYIKHPEIFKYSGDQEDKQWLYDHNLMPATGGKAYMLLVDDIKELAESDEYRNNSALMTDEIVGFTVPENMVNKMKQTMTEMRTSVPARRRGRAPVANSDGNGNSDVKMEDFTSDEKHGSGTVSPTDDLDLLGSVRSTDPSPFSLGTGFEDVSPAQPDISPAPSDMSATFDPPLSAPFDIGPTP